MSPTLHSSTEIRSLIVIPARLHSTRLAKKLLLNETGRPLIQHTYDAAKKARLPYEVCVATDSEEIFSAVQSFSGWAEMTSTSHRCGTDRVAEVAARTPQADILVNVQGDEPELSGTAIDRCIGVLEQDQQAVMATLAVPIHTRQQLEDPACVKVVMDGHGRAMYFSRSMVPHPREWNDSLLTAQPPVFHQHIGIYAYRREFLLHLAQLPPSPLEQVENLEQLRVLEAGHTIGVSVVHEAAQGIDTPEDYAAFVRRYQELLAA